MLKFLQIYMANDADQKEKFGEKVTYLKAAVDKINEAIKLLKVSALLIDVLTKCKYVCISMFQEKTKKLYKHSILLTIYCFYGVLKKKIFICVYILLLYLCSNVSLTIRTNKMKQSILLQMLPKQSKKMHKLSLSIFLKIILA